MGYAAHDEAGILRAASLRQPFREMTMHSTGHRGQGAKEKFLVLWLKRGGRHMPDAKKVDRSAWLIAAIGVAGGVIGAGITGAFSYLGQKNDLDGKMIELSIGVLRADPTPGSQPLRAWAIDVIQKRGNFTFNQAQQEALLKEALPFKIIGPALPVPQQ
jgi:hypothetical protein